MVVRADVGWTSQSLDIGAVSRCSVRVRHNVGRLRFRRVVGFRGGFLELLFEFMKAFFGAGMQEAEIPDLLKASGQDML